MSEENVPDDMQPSDPGVPEVTITKIEDRRRLDNYLKQNDVREHLESLARSSFAPYKKPTSAHENCINIFGVSLQKKVKDYRESTNCQVMNMWRQHSASASLSRHVPLELEKAVRNLTKGGSQSAITSFFVKKPKTNPPAEIVENIDAENNNSKEENPQASTSNEQISAILGVFGVSEKNEKLLKSELKIDSELFKAKTNINLIKKFKTVQAELEMKRKWEQSQSQYYKTKLSVHQRLKKIEESFVKLSFLADRKNYINEAEELPMDEMVQFLQNKREEMQILGKETFLQVNSGQLTKDLKFLNHEMQKRISARDLFLCKEADKKLVFKCHKAGTTWEDCVDSIESSDWSPSSRNGNILKEHFSRCYELFRGLGFIDGDYFTGEQLLTLLGFTENKNQKQTSHQNVLNTLVEHLPILMIRGPGTWYSSRVVLINIETFIRSESMITDLMKAVEQEKSASKETDNCREGELPEISRKVGSGRIRRIVENPEILENVEKFTYTFGAAAEDHRRDDTGRVGFTMSELHSFIKVTCFAEHPEKAPAIKTLRRIFQAPNKGRAAAERYKADINCKPGVKSNDAPGPGGVHPHRHECFCNVRLIR